MGMRLCRAAVVWGAMGSVFGCRAERAAPARTEETAAAQALVRRIEEHLRKSPAPSPIDGPLTTLFGRRGDRLLPRLHAEPEGTARRAELSLPVRADAPFRLADVESGVTVDAALVNPTEALAETSPGFAVYREAIAGADALLHPTAEGIEALLWLRAGTEIAYELTLGQRVMGLRQVGSVLEVLEAGGAPRARISAPWLTDTWGARHGVTISTSGCAIDESPAPPWGRPVTVPGARRCTIHFRWAALPAAAYPLLMGTVWTTTGSMHDARASHAAARLPSGRVLVAGGMGRESRSLATSEVYDPATGAWAVTSDLGSARTAHTITLLNTGRVLVAGGSAFADGALPLTTAELYDATTGLWTPTKQPMTVGRAHHAATLLENGGVLLTGGDSTEGAPTASTEVYQPATDAFYVTGSLNEARRKHVAVRLGTNQVLVAGGQSGTGPLASSELSDLPVSSWERAGPLQQGRYDAPALLLADNTTAVIAGGETSGGPTSAVEWFSPSTGIWSAGPSLSLGRSGATMVLPGSGALLVAGGDLHGPQAATDLGDPTKRAWTRSLSLATPRERHTSTVLAQGRVLVVGGLAPEGITRTAEVQSVPLTCESSGDCASGFCANGYCCNTACDSGPCARCDLPGQPGACGLAPPGGDGAPTCAPYVCGGTSSECTASCGSDSACAAGYYCVDHACAAQQERGLSCASDAQCATGFCSDRVCCDHACNGGCDACVVELGASSDGVCTPLPAGSRGSPACAPFFCTGDSGDCPTRCDRDAQCAKGRACVKGDCVAKVKRGEACLTNSQCLTGFCSDGVCCGSACGGGCDVCARRLGAVADGTCSTAPASAACGRYLCDGRSIRCPAHCRSDASCSAETYCVGTVCVPRAGVGTACSQDDQCLRAACGDGVCVDPSGRAKSVE
jgi:hypothetical protein